MTDDAHDRPARTAAPAQDSADPTRSHRAASENARTDGSAHEDQRSSWSRGGRRGDAVKVVIVGAGPRGLSALERIVAHAALTGRRVSIDIIDPFPPGPGHVWRTNQSPRFLMNTPSVFPTVIAEEGALPVEPIEALRGMSFARWKNAVVDGSVPATGLRHPEDTITLATLGDADFPQRRIYGLYLNWVFEAIRDNLPEGVELRVHRDEAVAARPRQKGRHRYSVEISGQQELLADHLVLALGHLDAQLRADQKELVDGAAVHGLTYKAPAVPADVYWGELPAGRTVLIRGMGLNFHDVITELTEGRAGVFYAAKDGSDRLVYEPSGHEPFVVVGSRRGTPYRAKAEIPGYYASCLDHRYLTEDSAAQLAASPRRLSFDQDILPLVRKDATRTYYRVLARTRPEVFDGGAQRFLDALDAALSDSSETGSPSWDVKVERLVNTSVPHEHRLNLASQSRPFQEERFGSHEEYAAAVVHWLDRDAAGSARGEDDPVKMAFSSLNWSRTLLKRIVAEAGITDASWQEELVRAFGPLVEGVASGPPALRIRQLAALARAGVVRFLGPDPVFRLDEEQGCFEASSPWVADEPFRADVLIEAMSPPNEVRRNISPLLESMHEHGLVRASIMTAEYGAATTAGPGLDVSEAPYRAVGTDGQVREGIWVLGLQLSSVQWGTSIAAEALAPAELGARTLADADAVAASVMA